MGLSLIQILGAVILGVVLSFAIIATSAPNPVDVEKTVITPVPTPEPVYEDEPEPTPVPDQQDDNNTKFALAVCLLLPLVFLLMWALLILWD